LDNLLIITPVKDSIETAEKAISKICKSKGDFPYLVYNDFSTTETKTILENNQKEGYTLINLEEIISTPSPNYRFVLQDARERAIKLNSHLLIVESDVFVEPDTISRLIDKANSLEKCGMAAALTVDSEGNINFPYSHIIPNESNIVETQHRVSFCCTLITLSLLKELDLESLSEKKDWFDVKISKDSRKKGFKNYILTDIRVTHLPHSSRPWKKLKYENPVKYYLKKVFSGKDRI